MDKDAPPGEPPTAVQKDPLVGKVLNGKFRIVGLIGRGGMGKIYKAEQLPLGRMVAVKLLSIVDQNVNIAEFRERFFREASLCARLSHPNIVTVHDYGAVEGADETLLIAMEFLEGKNLMERLKAVGRPLAPAEATAIVLEIARGMREAHKHGIVHRDLKCSNVMLVPDEDGATRVKILDFGLVKSLTAPELEEESLTRAGGGFLGSPGYMSPEQIQRGMLVDHRTDIYSLGVILFRCLAGRNPFEGDQAQVLIAHVNSPVPNLSDVNPTVDVPPDLERFMRRMLEKTAERRVSSAEEVVRSLREIQQNAGWTTRSTVSFDTTASFSKPRPIVLEPTPTTSAPSAGSIAPFEVGPTPQPESPPSLRLAIVGAVLGVAALAAVVTMILRSPPPPGELYSTPQTVAVAPPKAEPVVSKVATNPTAAVANSIPASTSTPVSAEVPRPAVAAPVPVVQPSVTQTPTPTRTPSKRTVAAKAKPPEPPPTPAPKPTPAPPVAAPTPVAAPAESGFLSLDTVPWSNVSEGGHALGQTPLMKVKLSAGTHTLTLTTQSGTSRSFIVNIKPGQTVSKRLGLE